MSERRRAAIVSLGCKVNWYDSQAMAAALEAEGFVSVGADEPADVYIVNTCAVTAEAERKSRQAVRKLLRLRPDAAVIAAGCSAQRDPAEYAGLGGLAAVCGTADRAAVVAVAERAAGGARGAVDLPPFGSVYEDAPAETQSGHTRAVLKIEDGCDARCAYCIIPDLRGAPRSRTADSIAREASALAARGFLEIVLVGINLSRYGAGLEGSVTLADAVEASCVPGIARLRLGSLEPDAISEGLLERLKALPQFCPHFHVSLQSGSAATLARMGRRYSPRQYEEKLGLIRRYYPDAGITTDVIVGFPGETDGEFAESAAFVAQAGFLKTHVFPYSKRPGTRAVEMAGQVPNGVKAARAAAMQAAAAPGARAFQQSMIGKTVPVLFESPVDGKPGWMRGYTPNYMDVMTHVGVEAKGKIILAELIEIVEDSAVGQTV